MPETIKDDIGPNRPPCANPDCKGGAVIMIGRKMFCGDCAVKVMKIKDEKAQKEEAYIFERLKEDGKAQG